MQDEFLDALFPGEITDLPGFVKCSSLLRKRARTTRVRSLVEVYLRRAGFRRRYKGAYSFCRILQTLRVTPAMEAGLVNHPWTIEELVGLLEQRESHEVA